MASLWHPSISKNWSIHAFEPDPKNRSKIWIPQSKKFTLNNNAVSNSDGIELPFYASEQSTGVSSLTNFLESHQQIATVKTTTLNNYFRNNQIDSVRFLKIDTEGHDLFVLQGMNFEEYNPEVILCEFDDYKTVPLKYDYHDIGKLLLKNGYQVFMSEWEPMKYGSQDHYNWKGITKYPSELSDKNGWGNFIAFKDIDSIKFVEKYLKHNWEDVSK